MARSVADTKLSTRTGRLQLAARGKPYYRELEQGLHLGYRRLKRGAGRWVARVYVGNEQYRAEVIGTADDCGDAAPDDDPDRARLLNYKQAQQAARRAADRIHLDPGASLEGVGAERPAANGRFTVETALRDYLAAMKHRGQNPADSRSRAELLIMPELGAIEVRRLTAARIRRWHAELATKPALTRPNKNGERKGRAFDPTDRDQRRRRKHSANKVLTVLKAALNHAWREGRVANPGEWQRVRPFKGVDIGRVRWLQDDEIRRLVNACPEDLRRLVTGALLTGCRYGELCAMRIGDFDPDFGAAYVAESKSGKPRTVFLTGEGVEFFAAVTAGRPSSARIFVKANGDPWRKSAQRRPLIAACKQAKIEPAITFHILRHCYATRAINNGIELKVIAENLGHSDTRMVEKHYGHMADSYRARRLREGIPDLGIAPDPTVEPLRASA